MILPPWVRPAIAATALLSAFACGWTVQGWRWSAADAERLQAEVKAKDKQLAKSNEAATQYEATRNANIEATRATDVQIRTVYRDRIVSPDCALASRGLLSEAISRANSTTGSSTSSTVPSDPANP